MSFIHTLSRPFAVLWSQIRRFLALLRRHLKKTIAVIVILLVSWMVYAVTRPQKAEYITDTATRGTIRQTVEAVGTVVSEKDLSLQFPTVDVVSKVFVTEGMNVKAGQRLASLRSGTLGAGVASANASLQSAKAALQALQEGARPEDIAIYEAQVANKRASLEAAKQTLANADESLKTTQQQLDALQSESRVSLAGQVVTAGSTIQQNVATAKTAIIATQGVFNANDVADSVVKSLPGGYDTLRANMTTTLASLDALLGAASPLDYQDALSKMGNARMAVGRAADIANRAYDIIAVLPITGSFSNTSRETAKTTIATQKSGVQLALSSLDSSIKALQDASANFDTRIVTAQSQVTSLQGTRDRAKADISTFETSLKIDEAQLALRKAPARQTDIDAARARVNQAGAELSRAASQFNDTILTAPVDGIVTKVNVKVGEVRPTTQASITMLGTSPYRVEMFISEVDIPKVRLGQSGSVTLDAFRFTPFTLRVAEIDTAATDKDGVPKYRVKLDFADKNDQLKVGMTGDCVITTGIREDVISVPARAVIENADGTKVVRIPKKGNIGFDEKAVTTGMDGGDGRIEVEGVEEGETVIVLIKE
ncbi:MAG: efflux RND transporter periplasmic adaptor subunit [Candidatus Peribacteraceae bacterium]|nr:efflux RND transporter periplasmic adaptor subunit [Candidatus Peribacteraceae bacterium]